jgi:capsular exopolysaccharide synthesis family protein
MLTRGASPDPADLPSVAQGQRGLPAPRGQAALPAPQAGAITPMGVLRALRRRSALALGLALLLAGIAGPAAWFLVPSAAFRAESRLQIDAHHPQILFNTLDSQGGDYGRYQITQKSLLKSRLVLRKALGDDKVASCRTIRQQADAMDWLGQKLNVEFVGGSELMEISLSGNDPEDLACIVNAVTQAYMDEVVNRDSNQRTQRHDHLKKLRDSYTGVLKVKREGMKKLAETVGSDDPQTLALRQQYELEHLHSLEGELQSIQSQKRKLEAQIRAMGPAAADEAGAPSERMIDQFVAKDEGVAELAAQLAQAKQKYAEKADYLRRIERNWSADPILGHLRQAVNSIEKTLAQRRKVVRQEALRQAEQPGGIAVSPEGNDLGRDLAMLSDLERQLDREVRQRQDTMHTQTVNTLDLHGNQEEIAQMQAVADKIGSEVEQLNIEIKAPPRIKLIDDASVPRTRDDKKRLIMIGMITFGSFFGGLLGVAFLELQARKVDSVDDVPVELGLSIVGAIPILPARSRERGAAEGRQTEKDRHWRNLLLESVDATRTLLLHAARTGSYRVVMITSAMPGEGKTSLASYLATSLAQSGLRTLLIDSDLRRPMLHKLFELPAGPGLSELLRGEVDIEAALEATAVGDLSLLPAGRCDRQALRSLSQGGIAPLLDGLKQQFDFIIVDSSPILPVADAMLVAQQVDAALFSIFSDVSRKDKVRAAVERLQRLNVPVLGAVVTGSHGGHYGNSYYDRDSYYAGVPESAPATSSPSDPS